MPDKPIPGTSSESLDDLPRAASNSDALRGPRADLARVIPRRRRVTLAITIGLAVGFGVLITPTITAERVFVALGAGHVAVGQVARMTVRVPPFAGYDTRVGRIGGTGGVVIARGDVATRDDVIRVLALDDALPRGPVPYLAYFLLVAVLAGLASHHLRRSNRGRLVRVQLVNLALIALAAIGIKALMLTTAVSVLVVPVALFAIVPTLALDRVTGLATGVLAALVVSLIVPFDVAVAIVLLAQVATAGLVVAEKPKSHLRAALTAGGAATLLTAVTYPLLMYLTTGALPIAELRDPLHSAWLAAALGPAIATVLAMPMLPLYQLAVGEITHGKLVELEDLSHPLLRQISEKAPGTWQHSLMMANMAEIAANAIGANGRLVRVGAYFHDLGKSLQPKYFIENLEPGEPSPHDRLAPEASCDAIFAHVTEGIVTARKSGLHERVIDFMHMHHGNGLLEYFWAKCREQGNPRELSVEHFRYPGVPPQSRETAILAICDAVEAASRTLKKPDPGAIDQLVQRIVYGKLHLGQLDESGLSMGDLRRVSDSLRETIRHANHGRIEYPWQKAQQSASAAASLEPLTSTGPRLDSLDGPGRPGRKPTSTPPPVRETRDALADTADVVATPRLRIGAESSATGIEATAPVERASARIIEKTAPPFGGAAGGGRAPAVDSAR
ncbi:MAG TPA: HDIG domain-containing protein, partial [Kofleriaceae bacterium]|nr:HDIG domain-containing protein [Kofleriaceae bacterium]